LFFKWDGIPSQVLKRKFFLEQKHLSFVEHIHPLSTSIFTAEKAAKDFRCNQGY